MKRVEIPTIFRHEFISYYLTNHLTESNDQRLGVHDNMYYITHIDFEIHLCYLICYLVQIGFFFLTRGKNRDSLVMMAVVG